MSGIPYGYEPAVYDNTGGSYTEQVSKPRNYAADSTAKYTQATPEKYGVYTSSKSAKAQDPYSKTNNSYSGADMLATITVPSFGSNGGVPIVVGELQTLSYSIHRPKVPVRVLGRTNPKGFVRGGRTIAGSLIFTVFDKHVVHQVLDDIYGADHRIITDEMPPFNITVTFANEYGQKSIMSIYGIEIVNEGQTMSIEDMITENVMNYVATGIDLMRQDTASGKTK
jgi:hypothetical protein